MGFAEVGGRAMTVADVLRERSMVEITSCGGEVE